MAQLHAAGVPAGEILLGATSWAAKALLDSPDFGTVEAGKVADLVIVRGNPLADIRNTRNVVWVVRKGRVFSVD